MHIENEIYDDVLQREVDYGRIKTYYTYDDHLKKMGKRTHM